MTLDALSELMDDQQPRAFYDYIRNKDYGLSPEIPADKRTLNQFRRFTGRAEGLCQDARVQVECDPLIERTEYRRYYKTAKGFSGRNCEMFLGQFVSLIARERVPAKKAIESARKLEFWHVIEDHY